MTTMTARTPLPVRPSARALLRIAPAVATALVVLAVHSGAAAAPAAADDLRRPGEIHFSALRQLTFGGENAEAYWSPDGGELIFQSTRPPYECDQIFTMEVPPTAAPAGVTAEPVLVSGGVGRTTCAYFYPGGDRVLYSSTRLAGPACPPPPDRSHGYVWAIYPSYEIFTAKPDGSDLARLTDNDAYDAEATICPKDGSIVFTSTRDGDLDLYRMDADGGNVRRLTDTPGYDGGAFYSDDCTQLVWRASRPRPGEELEDYRKLLAQNLVRPGKLELWVADADGGNARQITYLGAASFAPYFYPGGERVIFSSNYGGSPREFDLWAVDVQGTRLERITASEGFDGFPIFSPDGSRLAFSSNRNQGAPGETNAFVADWAAAEPVYAERPADRYLADVAWLADDARGGRGIGTPQLDEAAAWLAERFAAIGLEPAGDFLGDTGGAEGRRDFRQRFEVPTAIEVLPETAVTIDGTPLAAADFRPASFSASADAAAEVAVAGYGISAPEHGVDDYDGVDAEGKVVLVRRFVPPGVAAFEGDAGRRYSDLRYKAFNAREHGAVGLIVADLPEPAAAGGETPEEAPLPELTVDTKGDAGIPVVVVKRAVAEPVLAAGGGHAALTVRVEQTRAAAYNVVGRLASPAARAAENGADPEAGGLPGVVLLGAHYDHLGLGGAGSLVPDAQEPHNGADDNASGTAALLEAARQLGARRGDLRRDVYFVAFSAEEAGVLGSTWFTREPPAGLAIDDLVAMINMDMVGRLRDDRLTVLGTGSAAEWPGLLEPACAREGLECKLGGDGYGPSDQTPFYAAGVPVLHLFTGTHTDYHKPSDDTVRINAAGGAQVAALAADLAGELARRPDRLTYERTAAPPPDGDTRSYGASLGTVPDYAGPPGGGRGVLLAGVRPGSAAEAAGLQRGDILIGLAGREIADIYDFVFILREAKPGQATTAVVLRGGEKLELPVTFGTGSRIR